MSDKSLSADKWPIINKTGIPMNYVHVSGVTTQDNIDKKKFKDNYCNCAYPLMDIAKIANIIKQFEPDSDNYYDWKVNLPITADMPLLITNDSWNNVYMVAPSEGIFGWMKKNENKQA